MVASSTTIHQEATLSFGSAHAQPQAKVKTQLDSDGSVQSRPQPREGPWCAHGLGRFCGAKLTLNRRTLCQDKAIP